MINQDGGENWAKSATKWVWLWKKVAVSTYAGTDAKNHHKLAELQERFKRVRITDTSSVFNTDLLYTIELGHGLTLLNVSRTPQWHVKSPRRTPASGRRLHRT
ncbi:hypothetical protein ACLK1S_25925 [Escherichia coli]